MEMLGVRMEFTAKTMYNLELGGLTNNLLGLWILPACVHADTCLVFEISRLSMTRI